MKAPVVLVIDDEALVAQTLRMLLVHAGIEVLVVSSPLAAVETWNRYKSEIGLVISDFGLDTVVTGQELLQNFRADKPNLRTILLSGRPLDSQFGERTEGLDFFEKPFDSRALVAAVFRHLYG